MSSDWDPAIGRLLEAYGFDPDLLKHHRQLLREGWTHARVRDPRPPADGEVRTLPPPGSEARRTLEARGREALAAGQVACVVLAGGMATRFGGVVKATVPVLGERTFLDLKHEDIARVAREVGRPIPLFAMTSFATDAGVRRAAADGQRERSPLHVFAQTAHLRLTPDGELFRDAEGKASPYAPGHGDLPGAWRRSGHAAPFRAAGGRMLLLSNVDNLGATLDPAIVGAHLEGGRPLTVEVVDKHPGDKGGAPAWVDGRLQIVEAFRFPEDFDQDRVGVFNTNTLVLDLDTLAQEVPLDWFKVEKQVDGRPAIQFERLVGQLTAFFDSTYLRVPRDGVQSRFLPAKRPEDLEAHRPVLAERFGGEGAP